MRGSLGAVIGRYNPSSDGTIHMGGNGIINHNRKCKDIVFLVIFIAFWVAMIVNSSFAFNKGNPLSEKTLAERECMPLGLGQFICWVTTRSVGGAGWRSPWQLVPGEEGPGNPEFGREVDYKGNVCGDKHADLHQLELKYWLNPNQVYQSGSKDSQFKLADARSICLLDCPIPLEDSLTWVCNYPEGDIRISMDDWIDMNYNYYEFLTPEMRNSSLQLQGPCYPVIFPTVNVHWSCQFIARASNVSLKHWQQMGGVNINEDIVIDKSIHKYINSHSAVLKRYMADIGKAWPVLIVCGGILPLFLSVIWLLMIRHFVAAMPWITVVFFDLLIVSVTMFYYLKVGWIGNDAITPIIGEHDPYIHIYGRVAAKVIGEVQALIVFPIIPYGFLAVFYMLWISAFLHLFSSGQVVQNDCHSNCCSYDLMEKRVNCDRCCGYSVRYTPHIGVAILFHLFGCYWVTQFIISCSSTVIAGSVASYYWGHGEASPDIPFLSVFSSMKRLMRYSLGSLALGSLTVSFVELIRFMLESIRRKLKVSSHVPDNWFGKAAYHSSQFFLRCIEWTVKSVNRNAYIMIAITGKSFFSASAVATSLIKNNILRIGRLNVIGDVILFLGKLCVSLSSAAFAFLMLDTHKYKSAHNKISSPLFPVMEKMVSK
ncbi:choline transporter-like protein 2 [Trifolium pratense]|uniref:Choline transporter-like protein n=1 Tax=Trifolium pratense TaxID=57577 RepID=A0A2K3NTE7_TRIPR|nr:choline transporter-like protein 2 [Trifolium pratense]